MRQKIGLLLVVGLLAAEGVAAGDERERWDDSHMQSRYQPTPPSNRPRLEGTSGYAQVLNGGAETRTAVATQLEYTTQRQWIQGPLSTGSEAKSEAAGTSRSSGASAPTRGSQLRGAARRRR